MSKERQAPPKDDSEHEGTALSPEATMKPTNLAGQIHAHKDWQITRPTVPPALHSRGMIYWLGKAKKNTHRNTCLFSGHTPSSFSWLCPTPQETGKERVRGGRLDPSCPTEVSNHILWKCSTICSFTSEVQVQEMDLVCSIALHLAP